MREWEQDWTNGKIGEWEQDWKKTGLMGRLGKWGNGNRIGRRDWTNWEIRGMGIGLGQEYNTVVQFQLLWS